MPTAKTYWLCSFCAKKKWVRKSRTITHELTCYKNPDRVPYVGEMTFIGQTGKIVDYGHDDSVNGRWLEWNDHEMPKWWPGESGMIWTGEEWIKVPGYSVTTATGAHG